MMITMMTTIIIVIVSVGVTVIVIKIILRQHAGYTIFPFGGAIFGGTLLVDASTAWEMPACLGASTCSTGNFWTPLSDCVNVADAATPKQWGLTALVLHRKCHTEVARPASRESKQRV